MARKEIKLGAKPDGDGGYKLREAFVATDENFGDLYRQQASTDQAVADLGQQQASTDQKIGDIGRVLDEINGE